MSSLFLDTVVPLMIIIFCGVQKITIKKMAYPLKTPNVAVSCGYDTCFTVQACDGLHHLTKSMDRIETPSGFQSILWTFVRHTVNRCLIFPALPKVTRSCGVAPPVYLRVTTTQNSNNIQLDAEVSPPIFITYFAQNKKDTQ